jgi:hypothetical protein
MVATQLAATHVCLVQSPIRAHWPLPLSLPLPTHMCAHMHSNTPACTHARKIRTHTHTHTHTLTHINGIETITLHANCYQKQCWQNDKAADPTLHELELQRNEAVRVYKECLLLSLSFFVVRVISLLYCILYKPVQPHFFAIPVQPHFFAIPVLLRYRI